MKGARSNKQVQGTSERAGKTVANKKSAPDRGTLIDKGRGKFIFCFSHTFLTIGLVPTAYAAGFLYRGSYALRKVKIQSG